MIHYRIESYGRMWPVDAVLYEDGVALTMQGGVAATQAAPGSARIPAQSGGTLTIYVHPSDSSNPNTNGKNYRWVD